MEHNIPTAAIQNAIDGIQQRFTKSVVPETAQQFIEALCSFCVTIQHQYLHKQVVPDLVLQLIVGLYKLADAIDWYNTNPENREEAMGYIDSNIAQARQLLVPFIERPN